jgi:pilus assembly protein CpaF
MTALARTARIDQLIRAGAVPDPAAVADVVAADGVRLGSTGVAQARQALAAEVLGLGPLERLLDDVSVTDVLVNGDGSVWLDRGAGLHRCVERLTDGEAVRRLAVRLAGLAGRRLDESQPWVDGLLPAGIRLHAVLPPISDGAHVSLRVPRRAGATLSELQAAGMFDARVGDVLRALVERRVSCVISGGTGTGKTTLLGALLAAVPPQDRIVLVEDVRELPLGQPHVVRLQGRGRNVEGRGEVTLADLVRQALRMRPDRLVVGEVRGAEVRELLAALNTGHEGGFGTVHANRAEDVPARFEALAALAAMGRNALHAQLLSSVQAVIHLQRQAGLRRVESISILEGGIGLVRASPALSMRDGTVRFGPGRAGLERLIGPVPGSATPRTSSPPALPETSSKEPEGGPLVHREEPRP